ncbi:hypothetical protein ACFFV7_21740 [Nonomuraea spiralis]|uniref:Uncharacterized protein n=1 Tax=Nonomuraea spiralis TaxID=46182 RepID=A0ABV5IH10_9ACTN|nr:hypothetical protein [Nonomuraea spiralis]GGS97372.1 hypothetical protein GCM10010176_046530 [Nonomuraea spiralis]
MRTSRPLEFLIVGGFVLSVSACAAVSLVLPGDAVTLRVVVMGAVVPIYSFWSRSAVAGPATAVMSWFFATGFLVNGAGELTFASADVVRALVFLALGFAGGLPVLSRSRAGSLFGPVRTGTASMSRQNS